MLFDTETISITVFVSVCVKSLIEKEDVKK
jgi:hypothetical protein